MTHRQITDSYSVSPQITADQIAGIKAAGFRSVICNRPDNEDPGQPSAESIRRAAEAAGLGFRHIPVISGQMTPENVEEQARALQELDGPVFAYCRSGTRCANLHAAVQQLKG